MRRGSHVIPAETPPPETPGQVKIKAGGGYRKWIRIESSGRETLLENVTKYEIMQRVQIHARDLRILDPLLSYPSTIMGRDKAIVLNLEHIKAIITSNEVLLGEPSDESVIPVVEELRRRLTVFGGGNNVKESTEHNALVCEEDDSPTFEFVALEVALEAICSYLAARITELEAAAYPALDELTAKISSRNLDRVRKLKSAMTRLTARVQKVREELEQLLGDDDDMAHLYLSRKSVASPGSPDSVSADANWFPSPTIGSRISRVCRASVGTSGADNDVEELEMLLEAYFIQIDGLLNKLTTIREYIDDTEDYINIQLDNHRNQLIRLELFLSAGTLCLSIYSLVTGIFGVNLPYVWNQGHSYMFKWVVLATTVLCAALFMMIMSYARYKGLV